MDFFSGSQPDLVNPKIIKELAAIKQPDQTKIVNWTDNLSGFYDNYIKPNMVALVIFILVGIFLFIKYVLKCDNDEKKKEKFISFNPNRRLNQQKNYAYYVGDDVPVNYNGKFVTRNDLDPYVEDTFPEEEEEEEDENDENAGYEDVEREKYQTEVGYIPTTADVMNIGVDNIGNKQTIDDLAKAMFEN